MRLAEGLRHLARPRGESGFTLVEILLVLAVIGLMAGLMVVNMGGLTKKERLRAAARKLAGMSDFVRAKATGSRRTAWLEVDIDKNRYRFRQEPPMDSMGRYIDSGTKEPMEPEDAELFETLFEWEDLPRDVFFRSLFLSTQTYYDRGPVLVEYFPSGTLQSFLLHLQGPAEEGAEGAWFSIFVNGLTGKSEVFDYKAVFPEASAPDFSSVMSGEIPGSDW
jgi:type II secretion system protein H